MNIFFVDADPCTAAQSLVDSHVVKMPLEAAQLLSTAHRVLDGEKYVEKTKANRNITRWRLNNELNDVLYKSTHVNHRCSIWVRESEANYNWLYAHFIALLNEYTFRYGKIHGCSKLIPYLINVPDNLTRTQFTAPALAMPDVYQIYDDPIKCYRLFYCKEKAHLFKWTKRNIPEWVRSLS